ncbi:unnamed protein product [Caenorhabditis sp. 36 PRJEB53466]|nr:unnamed protein product [Caenorhabditis sp. 36 PRJEB53466]
MHRTVKYLLIVGGSALAAEKEPIREIERIRVEPLEKKKVQVISENCGQLELARRAPACFLTTSRQILVAGGCQGPNEHSDTSEIYDVSNFQSKLVEEKLEIGASCSAFDPSSSGKFKPIFGGFVAHSCLDDVQVIEESTWKCRKLPNKLPKIKNSTVLEVKNGEFLLFGGWEDEQRTTRAIRRVVFNEDFTECTVEFAGFLPYAVEGHSCVRNGSDVYLIGGFDGCAVIDTIVKYNLETKQSEILPTKLFEKRENHVSALLSGRFLVVAAGWNGLKSLDDVEVFEIGEHNLERCHVAGSLQMARNRPSAVPV